MSKLTSLADAISAQCPSKPKPVTSVQADIGYFSITSFAFLFKEDMGQRNYAAINYFYGNNILEELELKVLFNNKFYNFYFSHLHYYNERTLFGFILLNIHHNHYILGREPWDYDNNALVTLCSRCHQKRHQQTKIPLYTSDRQLICSALPVCDRCNGTGYLSQFHYYMGGICFKCHGEGVYGYE